MNKSRTETIVAVEAYNFCMPKIAPKLDETKHGFRYGIYTGAGSLLIIMGLIVGVLIAIFGTNAEREVWCTGGFVTAVGGWILVRHVTKSAGEALEVIISDVLFVVFNPFTWF